VVVIDFAVAGAVATVEVLAVVYLKIHHFCFGLKTSRTCSAQR